MFSATQINMEPKKAGPKGDDSKTDGFALLRQICRGSTWWVRGSTLCNVEVGETSNCSRCDWNHQGSGNMGATKLSYDNGAC